MLIELLITVLVVASVAAPVALLMSFRRPDRAVGVLVTRTVFWLVLGTFVLTIIGCAYFLREKCLPDDNVCDAPAMAAMGVTFLGGLIAALIVVVGAPAAYVILRLLRRK
jgi:hypothetical protein